MENNKNSDMFRKERLLIHRYFSNQQHRLVLWRISHISEKNFIYILSLIIGICSGFATLILKNLIFIVEEFLTDWLSVDSINLWYLVYPLIGITLTILFVKFIVKDDISHGVSKILHSISRNSSRLKPHNSWSSMVASSLTIGFGGSVGAEAPIVLTGASIGSNLAKTFRLSYKYITLMLACGVAGAIAGIFNAPMAGIVFTLEVLMIDLTMAYLIPLLISACTATVITFIFMGNSVMFHFANVHPFQLKNIWLYILLGILTGLLGIYFTRLTLYLEKMFSKIKNWILRLFTGGIILGVLIFIFPPLWGEGYEGIKSVFSGNGPDLLNNSLFFEQKGSSDTLIFVLAGILLFKVLAMSATTASGGIGGIFAPTLFMGAMGGYFFVKLFNTYFNFNLPEDNFALAGMAGMMAAVMHAPLTGIFLTAELTSGYDLFIPLLITSTVAYLTIMRIEPHSIYTKKLALTGQLITHHKDKATLILMEVKKLIETDFEILQPNATLGDLAKAISRSKRNLYPVVDSYGYLKGMVKLDDVKGLIFEHQLYDIVKVNDLMYMPQFFISPEDDMEKVVGKFETSGRFNLAVIDNGKYLGFISRAKVFSNYRKSIQDSSNE